MSDKIKLGDTFHFDVSTNSTNGSGIKDAEETPRYFVYEESTDTPISSGNFTLRSGRTGQYKANIVCSTGNGYEAGKYYNVEASGKVDGETGHTTISRFQVLNNNYDSLPTISGNAAAVAGAMPTISGIVNGVWDEPMTNHNLNNTFGSGVREGLSSHYYSMLRYIKDSVQNQDEYLVQWYRNSTPLSSGNVLNPAITIYRTDTGAALVSNKALSYTSLNNGSLRTNELVSLVASGEPYMAVMSGLIDSSNRVWAVPFGIDVLI